MPKNKVYANAPSDLATGLPVPLLSPTPIQMAIAVTTLTVGPEPILRWLTKQTTAFL